MAVKLTLPKRSIAFAFVWAILLAWGVTWAFIGGRSLGHEHRIATPIYCKGLAGITHCIEEQSPPNSYATCHDIGEGNYACDVNAGLAGCYAITAKRTREGYPLLGTVAQKPTC